MNEQVLTRLMVIVERAVRPVRAGDAQKLRMREELLDHLTALYEEEFENLHDEAAAIARAEERFGTPGELTEELRQSISWLERIRYWSDLYRYRSGEPLLGFALRHLLLGSVIMTATALLVMSVILLGGRGDMAIAIRVGGVMAFASWVFTLSLALIGEQMGQILYGHGALHATRAMVWYSLLSLLVFPLVAAMTYGLLMPDLNSTIKGFLIGCVVAPAAPFLFYMQARQMKKLISSERPWRCLEIDQ